MITEEEVPKTFPELQKIVKRLERAQGKAASRLAEVKQARDAICPHEGYVVTVQHEPGSHVRRSHTHYQHRCEVCGKILKAWTKTGSYTS